MKIGVVKESFPNENRVALIASSIPVLTKKGFEIYIEKNAGLNAGYPDSEYAEKKVRILENRKEVITNSEIILMVRGLGANKDKWRDDIQYFQPNQVYIGMLDPLSSPELVGEVAKKNIISFSMELIPRITRAQSMDVLSSMASISGYKSVLIAAGHLPKLFPMMMTAAGTITPAKVFVIGAGVAGLQAIATAKRLGAVVHAYDVRPAVKQEVESLGAKFVVLDLETNQSADKSGYAKEMDEEFYKRQRVMMSKYLSENDVIITTAAVPGKKAPVLITKDMVKGMKPNSIIIDLAAEQGGNCELTKAGETIIENGVTIIGPVNLPSTLAYHASQMYSKNISTFLLHLVKDGKLQINLEDEIIRETLLTHNGEVVHPRIKELLNHSQQPDKGDNP